MPKASPRSDDYLHVCADRHAELASKLSGTVQDAEAVEKAVATVRSRGTLLGCKNRDVEPEAMLQKLRPVG